jgi:hypothetical protein
LDAASKTLALKRCQSDAPAPWPRADERSMRILHRSMKEKGRNRKKMKAKLLSFAFIYFSESGLFNELRPIQIKNLRRFLASTRNAPNACLVPSSDVAQGLGRHPGNRERYSTDQAF